MRYFQLHVFDLDGVLVDTSSIHTKALRQSVRELVSEEASKEDFLDAKDGIKTADKLKKLQQQYSFDINATDARKKELTHSGLQNITASPLREQLQQLKNSGVKIALASNSRKEFVNVILQKLQIYDIFDLIMTGDDIENGKPNPEIFIEVINHFNCDPSTVVVYEDSEAGLKAALAANVGWIEKVDPVVLLLPNQLVFQ